MEKKLEHAVFVYGTLMRGERAAHLMAEGEFAGEYTLSGYAIYDLGRYPGILAKAGSEVDGEVYYVSDEMLAAMDEYEDEGTLYHRRKVPVKGENGALTAWVYVYAHAHAVKTLPMGRSWREKR
jgi:gamma-glutamylcyclotransferase (GGCT)/AIG2-like uncharacterized protein YtfP